MTRRLLLAVLLLLPTLCAAQAVKVRVNVPASQATFDLELPSGPTAAELSEPGALQRYVDKSGPRVTLPAGRIVGHAVIDDDSVTLEGAGPNWGDRITGTVLVPADPSKPVVTVRDAVGVTLRNFGCLDGSVAISLEGSVGALCLHTHIENVSACRFDVGVRISEPAGTRKGQHCAADTTLDRCRFTLCKSAVELNHPQAVNVHLQGCYAYSCDTFVTVRDGGHVTLRNCASNPVRCILRVLKAGGNQVPYVVDKFYADRTGGAPMPIIIDASKVEGTFLASVTNYSCSYQAAVDGPWADVKHEHFIGPASDYAKKAAVIDIKGFNAPGTINPN